MLRRSLLLLLFPMLMLVGCASPREPQRGDLQTLHRSPLRQLTGDAYQLVAIFPDGNHALLTDSIFG